MADIRDITDYVAKDEWNRRKFLLAAGLISSGAAALPILEACGGSSGGGTTTTGGTYTPPKPKAGAKVQLLQWNSFVLAADQSLKALADSFNQQYGTQVTIQTISADQLPSKWAAAVESGSGPDIMQFRYDLPHLYSSACLDVTPEVNYLKGKLGTVKADVDSFCKVGGTYRAVPYTIVPNAWSYRTDIFTQAGISSFPTTWDALAAAGKTLKDKGIKEQIAVSLGHAYGDAVTMWHPVMWDFGGQEVSKDGKTVMVNSKEVNDALNWAINAYKNNYISQNTLSWLDPDNNQAYHSGGISATLNGASIYIKELTQVHTHQDTTNNAAQPSGPKGHTTLNLIWNHSVMKWSQEADTAKAFILYLMDKDNYNKWMTDARGYNAGPFSAFDNHPIWSSDPKLKPFHDVVNGGRWIGWPAEPSKYTSQSQNNYVVVDMFAKAVTSGDAKAAMADAEQKLKNIYGRP